MGAHVDPQCPYPNEVSSRALPALCAALEAEACAWCILAPATPSKTHSEGRHLIVQAHKNPCTSPSKEEPWYASI